MSAGQRESCSDAGEKAPLFFELVFFSRLGGESSGWVDVGDNFPNSVALVL